MKGIATTLFISALLFASGARAQAERFEGIWQSESDPQAYYSLHIDGDRVVLVDLKSLEMTGATLSSTFSGRIGQSPSGGAMATVEVLQAHPDGQRSAEIFPGDEDRLHIYWCNQEPDACVIGILTHIRKVF